ncbi:helix-turn-helix domain-containing protein [Ramlibacter albus]|uniref:Helix-turn-helix transcriptional regulator n=1 Tax=Ramlibacter albus TaxID=2079448 RepID=A0A923M878_9BURK|nr:helix-turn-helix transcriptional regulator [Ramlibacter albus]MBC5765633.1 helix-turn-helix transcriptional regulator [Ramlibacter albus]
MAGASRARPLDPIVSELVRARKARGLSQQEVADKAGISRRALVAIEAGGDCTLSTLRGLCAALGVDLTPSWTSAGDELHARSFATADAMSAHQEQREVAQALRVQAMLPFERARWLASTWGALQRQAVGLQRHSKPASAGSARHFASMDAKNRFDEQREMQSALDLALSRQRR